MMKTVYIQFKIHRYSLRFIDTCKLMLEPLLAQVNSYIQTHVLTGQRADR